MAATNAGDYYSVTPAVMGTSAQLDAGVGGGEAPVAGPPRGVAAGLPGGDLGHAGWRRRGGGGEALAAQDAELDLGDVQPAAVLGGVVQLQLVRQAPGLRGREGLVQGRRRVGVQVVLDQHEALGVGVAHVDELPIRCAQSTRVRRSVTAHPALPLQRGAGQEQVHHPLALVLVVHPLAAGPGASGLRTRASRRSCLLVSSRQTSGRRGVEGRV